MALTDRDDHADQPSETEPTLVLEALRAHWAELAALDQKLLLLRFFGNMTPDEIGGQLGVPPPQAAELLQRALGSLSVLLEPAREG